MNKDTHMMINKMVRTNEELAEFLEVIEPGLTIEKDSITYSTRTDPECGSVDFTLSFCITINSQHLDFKDFVTKDNNRDFSTLLYVWALKRGLSTVGRMITINCYPYMELLKTEEVIKYYPNFRIPIEMVKYYLKEQE